MNSITTIIGARPQFIKAAAVSRAIARRPDMRETLIHTGQHFDPEMSDVFFDELDIPRPAVNLGIAGGSHGQMTGRMLEAIEAHLRAQRPRAVIVYGDTNSTLAGALAAAKLAIPVVHVEAGLRSFNRAMPEEINRVMADHLGDLLLCPTRRAIENLRREGIEGGVHHVGDVMYDTALWAAERSRGRSTVLARLGLQPGAFVLATVHRAENTAHKARLAEILDHLRMAARGTTVVMPLHPRTRAAIDGHGLDLSGLTVCPPVGYLDMAQLLDACTMVLTDSGGIQKEAYFHRKRCVTLREETEWLETITHGWNRLWRGPDFLPIRDITDYGTGNAAGRIVELLAERYRG